MAVSVPIVRGVLPVPEEFSAQRYVDLSSYAPLRTLPAAKWQQDLASPLQLRLSSLASTNPVDGLLGNPSQCPLRGVVTQGFLQDVSPAEQDARMASSQTPTQLTTVRYLHEMALQATATNAHNQLQNLKAASLPPLVGPLMGLIRRPGYTTPSALLTTARSLCESLSKDSQFKQQLCQQVPDVSHQPPNLSHQVSSKSNSGILPVKRRSPTGSPLLMAPPPAKKARVTARSCPEPQSLQICKQFVHQQTQTDFCTANEMCSCRNIEQLVPLQTQQLIEKFNKHLSVIDACLKSAKSKSPPVTKSYQMQAPGLGNATSENTNSPSNPNSSDSDKCTCRHPRSSSVKTETVSQGYDQQLARREQRVSSADKQENLHTSQVSPPPSLGNLVSTMRPCVCCSRPAVFVCSKCRLAWYCSTSCQAKVWLKYCSTCSNVVELTMTDDDNI